MPIPWEEVLDNPAMPEYAYRVSISGGDTVFLIKPVSPEKHSLWILEVNGFRIATDHESALRNMVRRLAEALCI